ncbi:hypothetical protein A6302_03409 [Methylobrevis pamukkalensis]|uniref:Secreted protein n=1 Tax=Methylobrevis pamukkalensis TaxID=1439726 RepID=A0A1E3GYY3_9HYPH|nr:hypothetical protein A6302_03409 [Methylobrevis pamukkalensis]
MMRVRAMAIRIASASAAATVPPTVQMLDCWLTLAEAARSPTTPSIAVTAAAACARAWSRAETKSSVACRSTAKLSVAAAIIGIGSATPVLFTALPMMPSIAKRSSTAVAVVAPGSSR